jgi:FMN-dependent NADH-azoreductase
MKKILYITANPKSIEQSFSLSVGEVFINEYKKHNPHDEIVHLDLYKMEVPLIDDTTLSAWGKLAGKTPFTDLTNSEQTKISKMNAILEQFIAADKYVFVTPLWNFGLPPLMKAYFDNICIAGKTFTYTATGPVGLMNNKKALHIQARGGIYTIPQTEHLEMGDKYINNLLGFIGITERKSIITEGIAYTPDKAGEIKQSSINNALEYAKQF